MKVYLEREQKTMQAKPGKALEVIKELGLNPEEFLVIKNGVLVAEDEELEENDDIKIIPVISGG